MQILRRLLYIPVIATLVAALLVIFNVINPDIELPISAELIASIAGVLLTGLLAVDARKTTQSWQHPEPEDPPKTEAVIYPKMLEDTVDAIKEAENFAEHVNGRVKIVVDVEEEPEDDE